MRDNKGRYVKGHTLGFEKGYKPWNLGRNTWGIWANCAECSTKFRLKKYRLDRSSSLCCSFECYWKNKDKGKTKLWQRIKSRKTYRDWRTAVFTRDDYTCQECKVRGGELHPHHLKPKSLFPEMMLDVDNAITLCDKCHRQTVSFANSTMTREMFI